MSKESATTIRQPSTANLMLDSQDRTQGASAADFVISKTNSILNGFFTRVGVTEVVLEWFEPNITNYFQNNVFSVSEDISGGGPLSYTVTMPVGFYTVDSLLGEMADAMTAESAISGHTLTYTVVGGSGLAGITVSGGTNPEFEFTTGTDLAWIPQQLGFDLETLSVTHIVGEEPINVLGNGWTPDLRLYRYIDITSPSLTYNQNLKDSSTASSLDNVLTRWYFSWDNPPELDTLGYPILQGYTPFVQRRIFNPPKQIKWESNMPIGQLKLQVTFTPPVRPATTVTDATFNVPTILPPNTAFDFLMTLQVSEN